MASKAPKAEKVRDYFLTLRKFIDYYKNHISLNYYENIYIFVLILFVLKNQNIPIFLEIFQLEYHKHANDIPIEMKNF